MGTLVACGTVGGVPLTTHSVLCRLSAIYLPTPTGPGVSAQTPLGILKVPTVAHFPPQIRKISLQLYTVSCSS